MANIQEIYQKDYSDMPFGEFAQKFHQKFYSDMPFDEFTQKAGVNLSPPSDSPNMGFAGGAQKAQDADLANQQHEAQQSRKRADGLGLKKFAPFWGGLADNIASFVTLPGQVMRGEVDPMSDEALGRTVGGVMAGVTPTAPAHLTPKMAAIQASGIFGSRRNIAEPMPQEAILGAEEFGINLTKGQAQRDPAILSRENTMLGGGAGEAAQRIAQEAADRQKQQILTARDNINAEIGQGETFRRPADAAAFVGEKINEIGTRAQRSIALEQAARVAAAQKAEQEALTGIVGASKQTEAAINPQNFNSVQAGEHIISRIRQEEEAASNKVSSLYKQAENMGGEIDPKFFSGTRVAPDAVSGQLAIPSAYDKSLSQRITDNILKSENPIIPSKETTPATVSALNSLDNIANLKLGRFGNPSATDNVAGVNVTGINQARKILNASFRSATLPADRAALRQVINQFDNEIVAALDKGLFSGDHKAVDTLYQAIGARRDYGKKFQKSGVGDDAGGFIEKVINYDATPEEAARYLMGQSRIGDAGGTVRGYKKLETIFGKGSEEMQLINGASYRELTGGALENATTKDAQKIADNIQEFLTGRGSTFSKLAYSEADRETLKSYANSLEKFAARQTEPVQSRALTTQNNEVQMLIDIANSRLPPEDLASALIGYSEKITPKNLQLVGAIKNIIGKNTSEWNAIRQAFWTKTTTVADGKAEMGEQKLSEKIFEMLDGKGASLSKMLFEPQEIAKMRRYAGAIKATIPPSGTANYSQSGNRAAAQFRKGLGSVGMIFGSHSGITGAIIGGTVGKVTEAIVNRKSAREASHLFENQPDPISLGKRISEKTGNAFNKVGSTLEKVRPIASQPQIANPLIVQQSLPQIPYLQGLIATAKENQQKQQEPLKSTVSPR